jgi:glycosyltransferase involved in cell wall biosynthesis
VTAPLVSCIVAVCNGEPYLGEAIDSVLAQTWPAWELIVVDDGSTDASAAIAAAYGDRLQLIRQANAGVSAARNVGVARSRGELITFLDADDRLHPDKFALQVARFQQDDSLQFCDCHASNFLSPELDVERLRREHRRRDTLDAIDHGNINTWMLRRSLFDAAGGFTAGMRFSEDVDLRLRCVDLGARSATLADVLVERRLHDRNVTNGEEQEQQAALAGVMKAHLDRIRARRTGG